MTNEAADGCARGMQEWMTNKYCSLCSLREHTVSFQTYSTGKYFKVPLCYKFVPVVTFYAVMCYIFIIVATKLAQVERTRLEKCVVQCTGRKRHLFE